MARLGFIEQGQWIRGWVDGFGVTINPSSDPEALLNDAQARQRVSSPHFTPDEEEKNS